MAFGMTAIFGQYTVTWSGTSLGIMQGDQGVPTIASRGMGRMIDNSDAYGDMQLGGIYRGVRSRAMMRCLEYKTGSIAAAWPWGADGVAVVATTGPIGRDLYDMSAALVLTVVAGTPAATSPASLTASKTLLAPDFDVQLMFGPVLREVPLEFILFPYTSTNTVLYTKM